jgi:hypothetical protein
MIARACRTINPRANFLIELQENKEKDVEMDVHCRVRENGRGKKILGFPQNQYKCIIITFFNFFFFFLVCFELFITSYKHQYLYNLIIIVACVIYTNPLHPPPARKRNWQICYMDVFVCFYLRRLRFVCVHCKLYYATIGRPDWEKEKGMARRRERKWECLE